MAEFSQKLVKILTTHNSPSLFPIVKNGQLTLLSVWVHNKTIREQWLDSNLHLRDDIGILLTHGSKSHVVLVEVIRSAKEFMSSVDGAAIALKVHVLVVINVGNLLGDLHLVDKLIEIRVNAIDELEFLLVGLLSAEIVLLHHLLLEVVQLVEVDVATSTLHRSVMNIALEVGERTLKDLRNGLVTEGVVTILGDVRSLDQVYELRGVLVEGLSEVALVNILHPANRELVTEAGVKLNAVDGRGVAVVTPGGLVVVGSSKGVDTTIVSGLAPHGARVTGLHVVDDLLEHLLLSHGLEGLHELVRVEILVGEANYIWTTVIGENEEDGILFGGLEDLASGALVTGEDLEVGLGVDLVAFVVDDVVLIVVEGIIARSVVEGVGDGVFLAGGDIILGKDDDVLGLVAVLDEDVVGVGNIGLMSVVPVAFGASDEDSPVVSGSEA